jgi:Rrf2 family iron-sulfur cluster assembly transcriptional regulator
MLTQSVGYAASALGCIASMGGQPILVKEIAEACSIPAPYLAKIIHALSRKGLVSTQRGVGGGVTLARDPATLTLYDLCVALDDPIVQKRCMLGTAECSDERACPAHRFWTNHRTRQLTFLQETTIAQIAAFETRRLWRSRQASAASTTRTAAPAGESSTTADTATPEMA